MSLININNVSFSYSQQPILLDLTVSIEPTAFWAVIGPNGAGKSTLIQLIAGLQKPDSGTIHLAGKPLDEYRRKELARQVAMVRQEYVPSFGFTVFETVMMSRTSRRDFVLFENQNDLKIVKESLEMTETSHLAARTLAQLSGGERQRVFIARALAQDTPILLLDEPTNHLDVKHQVRIFDMLKQLQIDRKKTILAVTHDVNLAVRYCDCILMLGNNQRYQTGKTSQIMTEKAIKDYFDVSCTVFDEGGKRYFLPK